MAFNTSQPAYVSLRSLLRERTSSVVAWVGSGISASAGLPTWAKLRTNMVSALRLNASTFERADQEKKLTAAAQAERNESPWVAFQILHDELGEATFRGIIREQLKISSKINPPHAYVNLWKLGISGLLSLNLDRLATIAFHKSGTHPLPIEGSGFQVANFTHVLKSPDPFIINLHGIHEDSSTWVLTQKQLNALFARPEYNQFLVSCLSTRTVIFLGITADDMAVGGHLDRLRRNAPDSGNHYWITHRRDEKTNRWAEERQVRLIRYRATEDDHSELDEIFHDLLCFQPSDDVPPPVVLSAAQDTTGKLVAPSELAKEEAEQIREVLNKHAQSLLAHDDESAYQKYEGFYQEYDQAIYRAWYTTTAEGQNKLFQYNLHEQVARGGFGTVYKATDNNGDQVAVKVLNQEVRRDTRMLQGFRRGVRSMRILSQHRLAGMVPYIDATEIPAVVVMDWIDGPNLKDAIEAHYVDQWKERLFVAGSLADIIRNAHSLPERVLHRDIRPANIMLQGYYTDPEDFKIVVLDFDLSWHQGAAERSVVYGATTTGYLAPEQLQSAPGVTTRHASVDSFGIGMTMYFLVAKRDPFPTQHEHVSWKTDVEDACNRWPFSEWASLPARFARLIKQCTKTRQSERWDMSQISGELSRLRQAMQDPNSVEWADMLAEEIIARSDYAGQYHWDENKRTAEVALPSGVGAELCGDDANAKLELKLRWVGSGQHSHKQIMKWLPDAGARVEKTLKGAGWEVTGRSSWSEQVEFSALVSVETVKKNMMKLAAAFNSACNELRFD